MPHKCPICEGKCSVPPGFYLNGRTDCRSCGGKGVVWPPGGAALRIEGDLIVSGHVVSSGHREWAPQEETRALDLMLHAESGEAQTFTVSEPGISEPVSSYGHCFISDWSYPVQPPWVVEALERMSPADTALIPAEPVLLLTGRSEAEVGALADLISRLSQGSNLRVGAERLLQRMLQGTRTDQPKELIILGMNHP